MSRYPHHPHALGALSVAMLLALALGGGCHRPPAGEFTQGLIRYSISYDSLTQSGIPHRLLPTELTIRFKDSNTHTAIGGLMSLALIKNCEQKLFTSMVNFKFTGTRLKHTESISGCLPALYASIPKVTLSDQAEECQMLGLSCKRTTGRYSSAEHPFEIIYTNDIHIDHPNLGTPFEEIDGVMLAFTLNMPPFMMHVRATEVVHEEVDAAEFEAPSSYTEVDQATLQKLLQTILR
ncbi:MAG: hypothetical protein IJU72_02245 [Bacteroidales bacterium]|nr:hypothetical protein [Bacteroidales bacterium]